MNLRKISGSPGVCQFEVLGEISDSPNGKFLSLFPQDRLVCTATRSLDGGTGERSTCCSYELCLEPLSLEHRLVNIFICASW